MTDDLSPLQQQILRLGLDRPLAHRVAFKHRHPNRTPDFHRQMQLDWHSPEQHWLDMVFRGGAKSTIAEEAITLRACFREFRNGLIVGENFDRAAARLHAIRMELETNELLIQLFGEQVGQPWGEDKIVTSAGVMIQALGRGQSLRGIKHLDARPDLLFCDDLEGPADVLTPEARRKVRDWFDFDLLPAMEPGYMARMAATPLHPEALPFHVSQDTSWKVHKFPIYHLNEAGQRVSSWPDRFPLTQHEAEDIKRRLKQRKVQSIEQIESAMVRKGQYSGFMREYMCEAEAPETKAFKQEMIRISPQIRSWQPTYSMTDPARTVKPESATTGHAVWSWIGPKLVVWDAWARQLMPDEIVKAMFAADDDWRCVWHGIEEDGLNQWLLQPIRQEMARRGRAIPVKPLKAPPGKTQFIQGLQPFFTAREVEFAKPLPDLQSQLLGFPTGKIDAPNALAYALKMRPGAPIYDDFGARHIGEDLRPAQGRAVWLCLNATRSMLTGVACQMLDGCLRVFSDFIREGDPAQELAGAVQAMQLELTVAARLVAGPLHFDRYNNVGLQQAAARLPREMRTAVPSERGRPILTSLLQRERGGVPMVMVSDEARWTLGAMTGGYSRALLKQGQLADYAEEGPYRVLIEGLESFLGLMDLVSTDDEEGGRNYAYTADGRRYTSMLGAR